MAKTAVQTAPLAAAHSWTLTCRTGASHCPTTRGLPKIRNSYLNISVHGVVRDFFTAPFQHRASESVRNHIERASRVSVP